MSSDKITFNRIIGMLGISSHEHEAVVCVTKRKRESPVWMFNVWDWLQGLTTSFGTTQTEWKTIWRPTVYRLNGGLWIDVLKHSREVWIRFRWASVHNTYHRGTDTRSDRTCQWAMNHERKISELLNCDSRSVPHLSSVFSDIQVEENRFELMSK